MVCACVKEAISYKQKSKVYIRRNSYEQGNRKSMEGGKMSCGDRGSCILPGVCECGSAAATTR